jgi:hypothetical protein
MFAFRVLGAEGLDVHGGHHHPLHAVYSPDPRQRASRQGASGGCEKGWRTGEQYRGCNQGG